jgi:hypothetical protein
MVTHLRDEMMICCIMLMVCHVGCDSSEAAGAMPHTAAYCVSTAAHDDHIVLHALAKPGTAVLEKDAAGFLLG